MLKELYLNMKSHQSSKRDKVRNKKKSNIRKHGLCLKKGTNFLVA